MVTSVSNVSKVVWRGFACTGRAMLWHMRLGNCSARSISRRTWKPIFTRAETHRQATSPRVSSSCQLPAKGATRDRALPATVSRLVMHELLRGRLGFDGVSITDAMDMKAVAQGTGQVVDSIVALRAGVDLLLLTPDRAAQRRLEEGLRQAAVRGLVPAGRIRSSHRRLIRLRRWLKHFEWPDQSVVLSERHRELARRSQRGAC